MDISVILNSTLKFTQDFVFMMRNDEASTLGDDRHWKNSLFVIVPSGGSMPHHAGPLGKHQGQSGGWRDEAKALARAFIVVFQEGMGKAAQASWTSLGCDGSKDFGELWALGVVPP